MPDYMAEYREKEREEFEHLISQAVRKACSELGNIEGKVVVIQNLNINICRGTSANQRVISPGNDRHHSSPGHDVFVSEKLTPFEIKAIGQLPIPKEE